MFVSFEGLDGSGKSTQVERLREALATPGHEVVTAREPGGTALGEPLLYAAARAELVAEVIRPALERGADVVVDRYLDSSVAYQGVGRGLGLDEVLRLNLLAVGGLLPDRTFVLVVDPAHALARVGGRPDRIERADAVFHARVAGGYAQLAARFPGRIVVLDGSLGPDELAERIQGELLGPR